MSAWAAASLPPSAASASSRSSHSPGVHPVLPWNLIPAMSEHRIESTTRPATTMTTDCDWPICELVEAVTPRHRAILLTELSQRIGATLMENGARSAHAFIWTKYPVRDSSRAGTGRVELHRNDLASVMPRGSVLTEETIERADGRHYIRSAQVGLDRLPALVGVVHAHTCNCGCIMIPLRIAPSADIGLHVAEVLSHARFELQILSDLRPRAHVLSCAFMVPVGRFDDRDSGLIFIAPRALCDLVDGARVVG